MTAAATWASELVEKFEAVAVEAVAGGASDWMARVHTHCVRLALSDRGGPRDDPMRAVVERYDQLLSLAPGRPPGLLRAMGDFESHLGLAVVEWRLGGSGLRR